MAFERKRTDVAMLSRLSASSPTGGRISFTHRALIFVIGGAFLFLLFRWILAPDENLLEKMKTKEVNSNWQPFLVYSPRL